MSQEAWGQWGANDEKGALNYIGPDQVNNASALVQTGEVLRLTQLLSPNTPVPHARCRPQHFMTRDGGDYAAGQRKAGGFQFADDAVMMPLHIGTHIDALCHAWYDDKLYNGYLGTNIRSMRGAKNLGIEKMPPIVTRGVLLDMVKLKGCCLSPGKTVTEKDLQEACQQANTMPQQGDAIIIRTGWLESQKNVKSVDFDIEPGIGVSAAQWLAEKKVAIVGADNFAVEQLPFPEGTIFPVHQRLIRDYGIPLLEGMMLDPLVDSQRMVFMFVASALPIVGATGSPLSPVAIL